jgi:ribonuclease HII
MWEEAENDARRLGFRFPVGVDEAGRGPLAGPVVAAACFLPPQFSSQGIGDSKTLTAKSREEMSKRLKTAPGVFVAVGLATPQEIDEINILQASLLAMLRSVEQLEIEADFLLVDGNRLPKSSIPSRAIIKGDSRVQSIAAASIIAKVYRDALMLEYHDLYPEYGFADHKGYPTKMHRKAIEKYGPSPIHRMTFSLLQEC